MTERLVTPESFVDIAERLHRGKYIGEGVDGKDFVVKQPYIYNGVVYVGYYDGDQHVIAKMKSGSEIIGQNDAKIRTSENEYVKAELKRVELPDPLPEQLDVDQVAQWFEQGEKIDTGYIHGYRVTPLSDVVAETFKWYSPGEG